MAKFWIITEMEMLDKRPDLGNLGGVFLIVYIVGIREER